MSVTLGRLLVKIISGYIGTTAEKISTPEEIEEYLRIYSKKFRLGFKFDRNAIPHYNFFFVRKGGRTIGGFVVHNKMEYNRTLTLAPPEARSLPAFQCDLAELCMVWSAVKATPLESSTPMLFGMVEAGKLAKNIVACASNETVFNTIRPYFSEIIFEGISPALNSPLWVVTTPSNKYYSNFLRQAPRDFLQRAFLRPRLMKRLLKALRNKK